MKLLNKTLFVLAIIVLAFSVLGCTYLASASIVTDHHGHVVYTDHVDHANSLIQAIIPMVIVLLFIVCTILFVLQLEVPKNKLILYSFFEESPPPFFSGSLTWLFNPRSPPVR